MKTTLILIITALMLFPCLAQETKGESAKPPPVELQFGLQLGNPSIRVIGKFVPKTGIEWFCNPLGVNDNLIRFRTLDGKLKKTLGDDVLEIFTIVECPDVPIQLRAGEFAWSDQKVNRISFMLTRFEVQDGFLETIWQNIRHDELNNNNNNKTFDSNGLIIYFEGGFKKFDQADIPPKQDLDLIFAPKVIFDDYDKTKDCYEIRELVFFMRNNAKQKIREIKSENIVVLAADGKPAMIDGQPFTMAMNKGFVLASGKYIKETQSLHDIYSAFAKTQLPAGFYRLHWQVEVNYEDTSKKSFSSNELWVYHGKYEATKPVKKNLPTNKEK